MRRATRILLALAAHHAASAQQPERYPQDGPTRTELRFFLGLASGAVCSVMASLSRRGYVVQSGNRCRFRFSLTEAGRDYLSRGCPMRAGGPRRHHYRERFHMTPAMRASFLGIGA